MKAFKRYEFTVLTHNGLEKDFKNHMKAAQYAKKHGLIGYKLHTREGYSLTGKFHQA